MSQDVCHRQRRSLNEFQSGRAKKTRAEHARIKSSGAGAALREAPSRRERPALAAPRSAPNAQLNHAIKTFTTMRYIPSCQESFMFSTSPFCMTSIGGNA
ncbi:hypothetical protein B5X24_HaOG210434 [Helicoverpa armigera]|nr:hypothetical protein B5X24_HaOG210434 [Helicoverpa armigera]